MYGLKYLLLTTSVIATPVWAQAHDRSRSAVHSGTSDQIVVTGHFVKELDVVSGQSVVTGEELLREARGQIGDTLTSQPGVSATSFTPGASRPVLRGFQGERIRVLTDGLGSLDVSNTSSDHGVTIDPLTAERIEILRGPAVLLFGSQAIGGAVNVIDRRIPRDMPEDGVRTEVLAGYGSAADDLSLGGSFDLAVGANVVAHFDGSYRHSDDLRVGGFVLSPTLREQQLEIYREELEEGHLDEAEEAQDLAELHGRVPNTGTETFTLGGGLAWIGERANFGVSVGYYDSDYGVPARPGAEHHHGEEEDEGHEGDDHEEEDGHGEETVTIGMQQWRADMRGALEIGGGYLDSVQVRLGYADYEHTEFEGDEVGTVFRSQAWEGRLELVQAEQDGWRGVVGAQMFVRDFEAIGAEAFVPQNDTTQVALFTVQEFDFGPIGLELAGRYEHTDVSSDAVRTAIDEDAPTVAVGRTFDAFSGAIGLTYALAPDTRIGATASRATRAPSAEELFANGPHIATQAFEVGNPDFDLEKSWGLEAYLRGSRGPVRFSVSAYAQWFDDYIYEVETGVEQDELPVYQFLQADARYLGVEAELGFDMVDTESFSLSGDLVADYVDAQITNGGGNIPRIPPMRVRGGLTAGAGDLGGRLEVEQVFKQNTVAAFETATSAFTLVNASVEWHPLGLNNATVLILSANNIFDVDARRHASFTKDFVPLAGRDLRISLRAAF